MRILTPQLAAASASGHSEAVAYLSFKRLEALKVQAANMISDGTLASTQSDSKGAVQVCGQPLLPCCIKSITIGHACMDISSSPHKRLICKQRASAWRS